MPSTYNLRKRGEAKENATNDASETASAAKPRQSRRNAPNATKTTNKPSNTKAKKSGTRKSNRAGREDPQPAADPSLAITLEDLETLDAEDLKRKGQAIYVHLGFTNIHDELTEEQVGEVRNYYVGFKDGDFRTLMKLILPGYKEESKKFNTLVNHLQRAIILPADINDLPKHSDGKYCGVSLAALYVGVCGLDPNPRWKQDTLRRGIELQLESVGRGANHHRSDLSNEQLKRELINVHKYVRSRVKDIKSRLKLLQKLWASQGFPDYTSQEVPTQQDNLKPPPQDSTSMNNRAAAGDAAAGGAAIQFPQGASMQSADNRPAAVAPAAAGGAPLNLIPPVTPRRPPGNGGGNELANPQSQRNVDQDFIRRQEMELRIKEMELEAQKERRKLEEETNRVKLKQLESLEDDRAFKRDYMAHQNRNNEVAQGMLDTIGVHGQRLDDHVQRIGGLETREKERADQLTTVKKEAKEQADQLTTVKKDLEKMKAIVGWNAYPASAESKRAERHSFGPNDGGAGDQTEADDDEALSPKALTFSEGGKVSADKAEAEELKGALIDTFSKDARFHSLCQRLQQATSLSTDTLGGILAKMLRVFGSSEYSSEFMFDLMALLPSVAGLLGGDFKNFLLDTLSKYENFMKNMNKDDSPDGLRMKNLLLSSYMKLIQSFDTDNVLTSMIAELEVEKKDHGVRNVRNGILHLSSMLTPQPITLEASGELEFVEAGKAREIVALWSEHLTNQSRKVRTILDGNVTESELGNVVLCDRIRLSSKSFSAEAADVIAVFLNEPFMGGRSIASEILCIEFHDIFAGRSTDVGLQVLQTLCGAVADAELVDVNLSDNAIGQLGIGACKPAFKPSLEELALCNSGLSEDTMKEVADTLLRSGCVANLTKVHVYNNMSGEGGCKEFARILEKSSKLIDIRFSSTRAGKAGSEIVASALGAALEEGRNTDLEKLDLYDNSFGNEASQAALVSVIERAPLSYLNLGSCELGNDGVIKICLALVNHNSSLEDLNLSYSNMGAIGALALIDAAGKLPNLKKICLDGNSFKEDIVRALVDAFGDKLEEMEANDSDGEGDGNLSDDDSDEEADDNVPDVAGDNVPPDVDSFLAGRMSRLSMMSS